MLGSDGLRPGTTGRDRDSIRSCRAGRREQLGEARGGGVPSVAGLRSTTGWVYWICQIQKVDKLMDMSSRKQPEGALGVHVWRVGKFSKIPHGGLNMMGESLLDEIDLSHRSLTSSSFVGPPSWVPFVESWDTSLFQQDTCLVGTINQSNYQDPQGVVNGHPLTSKGLLMDILSVVLVLFHIVSYCFFTHQNIFLPIQSPSLRPTGGTQPVISKAMPASRVVRSRSKRVGGPPVRRPVGWCLFVFFFFFAVFSFSTPLPIAARLPLPLSRIPSCLSLPATVFCQG